MKHLAQHEYLYKPSYFFDLANQDDYSLLPNFDQILDAPVGKWRVNVSCMSSTANSTSFMLATAIAARTNLHVLNTWTKHIYRPSALADVDTIGETVDWVMKIVESVGPSHLNLSKVKSTEVQPEHLVAVLRSTFMWRDEVPGWKHALSEASSALAVAGIEPEEVLMGLE